MFNTAWGGSITFGDLGLENSVQYLDPFDGGDFTVTFAGGGNDGKYYDTGAGIRVYGDGTMTITAKNNNNISSIVIAFDDTYKPTTNDVVNVGTYNANTNTWTGSANSVVFTRPSGSGHWRVKTITVTTDGGTNPPITYTVTYDCNGGTSGCPSNLTDVTAGTLITIADAPTRTDYTFDGWSDGTNLYDAADEYTVNGNVTFTAQWTENTPPQPSGDSYALFSDNLEEGDYIIVYDNGAMKNTVNADRLEYTAVTPQDDIITTSDRSIVWHIAPSGDYWTIQSLADNQYAASTGVKNKAQLLDNGTDDMALWTASGNSTYEFVNKKNAANGVNSNLRKNGTYGFACYATSTGGPLSLYKSQKVVNVATPVISPNGGEFTGTQTVTINCETDGASIYYTLDGSVPTAQSTPYSAPFTINTSCTVKAIAINGNDKSAIATASFTKVKSNPGLAFSEESVTINYGQEYTLPTLTVADGYDGTITYSSSNSAITVDPTTGEVSFGTTAIDKTTTITATAEETDNFSSGTATYTLTVRDPNAITGNLNNATFETSYTGSVTSGFTSASGVIGEVVTVTYNRGTSNTAYINDNEIRLYTGNTLVFEVPEGYLIQSLTFNTSLAATADVGTLDGATWNSENGVQSVTFSGTGTTRSLSTVTIHLIQSSSNVAKPIITPATGTYDAAQTVTITSDVEGATIYYTTDGTKPTTESTVYTKSFVLSKNGTYTIKAIAVTADGQSLVTTSTITIAIHVAPPVFTEESGTSFTEAYTIHLTGAEGTTIYYAIGTSPVNSDGSLSGSALVYNSETGIANLQKAVTIYAVALKDGNTSEVVSASYTYSGKVTLPYYENFDEGLGNFTTNPQNEGEKEVKWVFQVNKDVATYGEERKYAFILGGYPNGQNEHTKFVGSDRLTSPVIDLTDYETATLNFIHAGHFFGTTSNGADTETENNLEAKKASCHLQVREEDGDWVDITDEIQNWFVQRQENNKNMYDRVNSGDIDLSEYKGKKIQISFYFTTTAEQRGVWNVLKFAVTGTEPEEVSYETVNMKTAGYVTYVVKNDIDWEKTLANNTTDETVNVHGYKVIEFSKETAVFAEFGVGDNEKIIPAETPIILKGTEGDNHLVIAKTDDVIAKVKNNLLKPSYGDVAATDDQHFLVFQKTPEWSADDPYNNYAFYKLKTGRKIPERKAYLNGAEVSETISYTTNATLGIFLLEDLGNSELTGITSPETAGMPRLTQGAIYDLSGRKVADSISQADQLSKGIYIVNGRKIIIK